MPIYNTTLTPTSTSIANGTNPTGGTPAQWHFVVGGTWAIGDQITIVLTDNGTGLQTQIGAGYVSGVVPTYVFTFNNKVYALAGSTIYFSTTDDPTTWNNPAGSGNGFITVSNYFSAPEDLEALAPYQGRLLFIGRRDVQVWAVDPDPANYAIVQTLPNIGTYAPLSVQPVGDMDVYMLYDSGVRSVRVRDASNNALIADVGTPIDAIIQDLPQQPASCSFVDPSSNRYGLFIPDASDPDNGVGKIYVFSYFPSSQIAAWSTYSPTVDLPTAPVLTATAVSSSQINLAWTAATSDLGMVVYDVYQSESANFFPSSANQIASGLSAATLTYSNTGLTGATEYYYYVYARDINGNTAPSNEADATTNASIITLSAIAVVNDEIDLSWNTTGAGRTYNVYRDTSSGFTPGSGNLIASGLTVTSYNDVDGGSPGNGNLTDLTQYYYRVIDDSSVESNETNAIAIRLLTVIADPFNFYGGTITAAMVGTPTTGDTSFEILLTLSASTAYASTSSPAFLNVRGSPAWETNFVPLISSFSWSPAFSDPGGGLGAGNGGTLTSSDWAIGSNSGPGAPLQFNTYPSSTTITVSE